MDYYLIIEKAESHRIFSMALFHKGEVDMAILKKIIAEYETHLKGKEFIITLEDGVVIKFSIAKKRLKHLLGFQYTAYKNWGAEILYNDIKKRKITYEKILKDKNYKQVEIRILNFMRIIDLLQIEIGSEIVEFNSILMPNISIKSKYIIFKNSLGYTLHFGLAEDGTYYPETWFIRKDDKYIANQILKKVVKYEIKIINLNY